jgi:hypothetical protein
VGILVRLLPFEVLGLMILIPCLLVGILSRLIDIELLSIRNHHLILLLLVLLESTGVPIHGHRIKHHIAACQVVDQDLFHIDIHAHFLDLLFVGIDRPGEFLEQGRVLHIFHLLQLVPESDLVLFNGCLHVLQVLIVLLGVHHLHLCVVEGMIVSVLLEVPLLWKLILSCRANLGSALEPLLLRLVHRKFLEGESLLGLTRFVGRRHLELLVARIPVHWRTAGTCLLGRLPLGVRHHLVGLDLLGILDRGSPVGSQLLRLVQFVVANEVTALDDLCLIC